MDEGALAHFRGLAAAMIGQPDRVGIDFLSLNSFFNLGGMRRVNLSARVQLSERGDQPGRSKPQALFTARALQAIESAGAGIGKNGKWPDLRRSQRHQAAKSHDGNAPAKSQGFGHRSADADAGV
ncbi:MAG: hypothetical protein HW387_1177 [Parachlamydiales bacterium]|nr:hypothetical protein [Parachlamydiales bacterium]